MHKYSYQNIWIHLKVYCELELYRPRITDCIAFVATFNCIAVIIILAGDESAASNWYAANEFSCITFTLQCVYTSYSQWRKKMKYYSAMVFYFVLPSLRFNLWRYLINRLMIAKSKWEVIDMDIHQTINSTRNWANTRLITIQCEPAFKFISYASGKSHMISSNIDLSHMFSVAAIAVLRKHLGFNRVRYLRIVLSFLSIHYSFF